MLSPAKSAVLRSRDIVTAVDGASMSALPYYAAMMYMHDPAVPVAVTVLRGGQTFRFQVPALPVDDQVARDTSVDTYKSLIPELSIFGRAVDLTLAFRNGLRSSTGIYVVGATTANEDAGMGPAPGDVIAFLNGFPIPGMQELREAIRALAGRG